MFSVVLGMGFLFFGGFTVSHPTTWMLYFAELTHVWILRRTVAKGVLSTPAACDRIGAHHHPLCIFCGSLTHALTSGCLQCWGNTDVAQLLMCVAPPCQIGESQRHPACCLVTHAAVCRLLPLQA